MTVTVLLDNDVVIKLAQTDTYVDALAAVNLAPSQVGSLRVMLRYMGIADTHRRERLTNTPAEADRLNVALQSIVELEMTSAESTLAASVMAQVLIAGLDFQEGELSLCVVAVSRGALDLCTGDKRALRSMPALQRLWSALSLLQGRCICLEQLFEKLCAKKGYGRIGVAVATSPTADETISFVYNHSSVNTGQAFIQGLQMVTKDRVERHAPGWLKTL